MISYIIKIFGLSGFFNPDLRQYRMKSALFTSRNPDFTPLLTRGCILKVRWLASRKDSTPFRLVCSNLFFATSFVMSSRISFFRWFPQNSGDFTFHWLDSGVLFFFGGVLHTKSCIRSMAIFFVLSLWFTLLCQVSCNFCALWYSLSHFVSLLEQLLWFLSLFFL